MKKMQKEPSGVSILIGCIFIFMNILLYIREKSLGFEYGLLYALGYNFWIICGAFLIVHYQIKSRKFRSNNAKKENEKKIINHTKNSNLSNEQKAIIIGMIGTIIFAGLSVYQILDKSNQEKSFIEFKETSLNECYDSVKEKYDEIFDTFKVCSPNENIGELCSYETQDIRSKIEELERNDMTNCRKWFLN